MSLLELLHEITHKLPFQSETEKTAFHEQIDALADEAVTDVHTLLHGAESDAIADGSLVPGSEVTQPPAPPTPAPQQVTPPVVEKVPDPLAGYDLAALQAEIAKREQGGGTQA